MCLEQALVIFERSASKSDIAFEQNRKPYNYFNQYHLCVCVYKIYTKTTTLFWNSKCVLEINKEKINTIKSRIKKKLFETLIHTQVCISIVNIPFC